MLSIHKRDNCCITNDGSVCIVTEIFNDGNFYRLGVRKFLEIKNLYDIAITSSDLQIYVCAALTNDISYIYLHDILAKGYRMPYWSSTVENTDDSNDNSDNDNDDDSTAYISHTSRYVVAAILHNDVL